jgi:cytochrome c oxidase cbb3-type subunit I/II
MAIVRAFLVSFWGVVAFLAGQLPQANLGMEYITFGRLRPLHTNAAIFAFAGNAMFAAFYYSTQRLCKTRMWSDLLSWFHFWGWQADHRLRRVHAARWAHAEQGIRRARVADRHRDRPGLGGFSPSTSSDAGHSRRERYMYVAIWFYIATIVTVAMLHIFNNLWVLPA